MRKLIKKLIPVKLFRLIEPYGHLVEAIIFNLLSGFPGRGMKVIGVTGTNGKTSTAFMIHRMLQEAGYQTGLMSTVAWGVGEDIRQQMHHYTNAPAPEFMQRLKVMRAAKIDYLVLEVTSQALAQHRVWGVPFGVAVLTNVTHDHLTYHGTFERYRDAKRRLFKLTNHNRQGLRAGVINAEDPSAELFESDIEHALTYGAGKGELRATGIVSTPAGSTYDVQLQTDKDLSLHIKVNIPGSFNVYNSLAAVGVGLLLELKPEQIEQGIAALKGIEGRMNRIDEGQDFDVIVDYAHSPDSFEKLFKDLKPVVKGKMIVVFGSLGGGDKGKRPLQGGLAGKFCDQVIVCEEDDRQEDPDQIMNDIAAGVTKAGKVEGTDLFLIHDRTEAIQFAFEQAQPGDTVLLLGKGHEKTIEHADGEHPWDEVAIARAALQKRTKG